MMFLSRWFGSKNLGPKSPVDETEAALLDADISCLEEQLKMEPSSVKIQQELLSKYCEAASVFAQAPSYRNKVDGVFVRMNELRNAARSNF